MNIKLKSFLDEFSSVLQLESPSTSKTFDTLKLISKELSGAEEDYYSERFTVDGLLDFSSKHWRDLPFYTQMYLSRKYQKEFAKRYRLDVSKKIGYRGGKTIFHFSLIPSGFFSYHHLEKRAGTRHAVLKPFYLAKHHVTRKQYACVMNTPHLIDDNPLKPITPSISQADEFLKKTNFDHISFLEWTYASMAGCTSRFNIGPEPPKEAIHCRKLQSLKLGTALFDYYFTPDGTREVAKYPYQNSWDIYDCHGNVFDLTQENKFLSKSINACGGNFESFPNHCQTTRRTTPQEGKFGIRPKLSFNF